jgi:uncharacterized membrane protein YhaH (DUF805 family)
MTAGRYLFGFEGRINRAKWWLLIPIEIGAAIVYYMIAFALVGDSIFSVLTGNLPGLGGSLTLALLVGIAYTVITFIVWLAVSIKRLHDRDKSGAWLWLFAVGPWACVILGVPASMGHGLGVGTLFVLAGFAISIWAFVELGCLAGTAGPNRFGPDPLPHYAPPSPVPPA